MNGPTYLYSCLDGFLIGWHLDVSLIGKFFGRPRVALADEVVHDDEVDITVVAMSAECHEEINSHNREEDIESDNKLT